MNQIWPSVTKQNPCGICGHSDWCCVGDRAWKCMREPSDHPSKDGGWYHFFEAAFVPTPKKVEQKKSSAATIDAEAIFTRILLDTTESQRLNLAGQLGVALEATIALQAAWSKAYHAWAFPMRDGDNNIIGIRLRTSAGKKWAVTGSRNGVFIPQYIKQENIDKQRTVFVCEGPTDLMALLSMNCYGVAKPSCNAGDDFVRRALAIRRAKRAVIISDDDDPGQLGAKKLQAALLVPSAIWTPPAKDVRKFLNLGGTKTDVDDFVSKLIWTKKAI